MILKFLKFKFLQKTRQKTTILINKYLKFYYFSFIFNIKILI